MSFEHKGCAEPGGVRRAQRCQKLPRQVAKYSGRVGVGREPSSMPPANPEAGANESAETLSESPQPRGLANYSKREIYRISQFLPEGRKHAHARCMSDSMCLAMQPELGPPQWVLVAWRWCQRILRGTTVLPPSGAGQLGGDVTGGPQCRSENLMPLPEAL